MAVIGANQSDLQLDIGKTDGTDPRRRDEEMNVRALVVHVLDAILGAVVLDPDPRLLGASPVRASTREGFVRTGFPEHTAVGLRIDAVLMGVGCTADLTRDGPVGRQLGQAPPKVRIDVPVQDLRTRIDVRVGIVRSQTGPHTLLLSSPSYGLLSRMSS